MSLPQDEALRAALHAGLRGATIAFDLDGTLVDTAPDLGGALNVVLMEQGLASAPLDTVRHLVGRGARALIGRGFALAGEPLDEDRLSSLTPRFIEAYRARIAEGSRPYPNLESTLDVLAGAGARLCVCTNKRTDLSLALLDALGLTWRFAAVVGADRAPAAKPDPRHYLAAIAAAGGDPARSAMVGDTDNDVLSAKAAGAPAVAVGFGYGDGPAAALGADAVIDDFAELPGVLMRLLGAPLPAPTASAIDRAS